VKIINECGSKPAAVGEEKYKRAWEKFISKMPERGLPLLLSAIDKTPLQDSRRGGLFEVLGQHESEFLLYVTSNSSLSVSAKGLLKTLTGYARLYPQTNLKQTLASVTPFFVGAKECFSSAEYDFPKQNVPSLYSSPENRERGREYLPLIEGSLKAGNCKPNEITQILNDLAFVGGLKSEALMDFIVQKHWGDSKEFARAYLDLANLYPFQASRQPSMLRAIKNLIPADGKAVSLKEEDANRITRVLGQILLGQKSAKEREAVMESLTFARPAYQKELHQMAGLLLKLP